MSTAKPFWLQDPDPDQTSVRFCCPFCFSWIRNREFEEHIKLAHPDDQSVNNADQSVGNNGKVIH